ncbi:flavin reductase [Streptomyces sp. OF3]|uniref:Flavin reductase n=1 Tax=Streptomyces alkaliterrae TaxID=2213162 RepID=A0A7W3WJ19_9ACTN|nr:flavin reductase [Streptomyces alkaliterrae]MBB1253263.1 flavin reductase [Streptomyces alkaliterrae]
MNRPAARALTDLLDYPVYVVTARGAAGETAGCLVGFASQCSLEPVRFTVWLSRVNHTHRVAGTASHLAAHLLAPDQRQLAELFGGRSGDEVDKFAGLPWRPGPGGAPILRQATAWFVGRVLGRFDGGDHEAFLLDPVECGPRPGGPVGPRGAHLTLADTLRITAGHPVHPEPADPESAHHEEERP